MYKIGICDDEKEYIATIQAVITAYFTTRSVYELYIYEKAELVLADADQLDLLFLDIEMEGMNGLNLKEQLIESKS